MTYIVVTDSFSVAYWLSFVVICVLEKGTFVREKFMNYFTRQVMVTTGLDFGAGNYTVWKEIPGDLPVATSTY